MARTTDETIQRISRADTVRDNLAERITSGALRPGDRLPSERALSAEFAVSRNVVREALGSLAAMGVVETKPGAGVYVADLTKASMLTFLNPAAVLHPSSLRTLLQVREVIEPGIAALAAQLAGPQELEDLHALMRESEEKIDDPEAYIELDGQIHDALARMSRNPVLIWISDGIRESARASREPGNLHAELRHESMLGHQAIFDAIAARDPARAAAAMRDHLICVQRYLLEFTMNLTLHAAEYPPAPTE